MSNLSTEMGDVNENFRQLLDQGFQDQQGVIMECLQEAQDKGQLEASVDIDLLGSSIINGWHGALVRMKATGNDKPLDDFKKFFLDRL